MEMMVAEGPAIGMSDRLERGPIPLYHQLERELRRRIEANEFVATTAFPTEEEICLDYGVSRVTVRRALDTLQAQGLILRRRGARSVMKRRTPGVRSVRMTGSLDEFAASAGEMRLRVIGADTCRPPESAGSILRLAEDEPATHLKILSLMDEGPVAFFHIYLPHWIGELLQHDLAADEITGSLPIMRLVEYRTGRRIVRVEQEIAARIADAEVAIHLGVEPGSALLVAYRTYYSQSEQPLETVAVHYHPERYRYLTDFRSR